MIEMKNKCPSGKFTIHKDKGISWEATQEDSGIHLFDTFRRIWFTGGMLDNPDENLKSLCDLIFN